MSGAGLGRGDRATGRGGDVATGRPDDAESGLHAASLRAIRLNPADKVIITYLAVIALLILIFRYRIDSWVWLCAGHTIAIAIVVALARCELRADLARSHRFAPSPDRPLAPSPRLPIAFFVRCWYPIALVPLTYKELTYLIPRVHPRDFDATLAALDHRILGVHPTVWLEQITWPSLTEILQLTYSTYYFLPVILGIVLWRNGGFDRFHFWVFVAVLGFYLSYLGYIAVPAIGPRFLPSIVEAQSKPLTGLWFFQPVRQMLDSAEGTTRDCFPSGHTELTLLVLYYARRFHRKTFWWLLPFGSGIIVSTVYLRYHYVVDVVAGVLLAFAVVLTATPLHRALGGKETRAL